MVLVARKFFLTAVLILSASGLAFFCFQTERNGAVDSNGALGTGVSDFNTMMKGLDTQISQLRTIDSGAQNVQSSTGLGPPQLSTSRLSYAQLAATNVESTLAQLSAARSQLQSTFGQTEANLTGVFFYRKSFSYYIIGGLYADTGLRTADNASVSFSFYSLANAQGVAICKMNYSLGNVAPESMISIGRLQCGSGSMAVGSVTVQFEWS